MKTCKIKNCENKHLAKGLCNMHYRRMKRNGICDYVPKPSMYKHGMYQTRFYNIWRGMKSRCNNKNDANYKKYGGRGITICERWLKFESFLLDMKDGYLDELQIDRIDNDGNYEPSNCRWATRKENNRNRRGNRLITYNGETKTLTEWAEILKIDKRRLGEKLNKCTDEDQTNETIESLFPLLSKNK